MRRYRADQALLFPNMKVCYSRSPKNTSKRCRFMLKKHRTLILDQFGTMSSVMKKPEKLKLKK